MKKINPDTSFLISCIEFKIDWENELNRIIDEKYEIIILDKVKEELKKVMEKGGKQGRYAKLALSIINQKKYKTEKTTEGYADNQLLERSEKNLIATQDTELKKRIKEKGNPIIFIRQKKYLKKEC